MNIYIKNISFLNGKTTNIIGGGFMKKKYEEHEFPFDDKDDINEIDQDGFTNFFDIEDLHNTELMNDNGVYPPRGSYTHIPTSEFMLPGLEVEETIEAFNKLNEYNNPKINK